MKNGWTNSSAMLMLLLAGARIASAGTITAQIGTQHFTDGQAIGTGTFLAAVAGQPAPFNAFIGSDISGPNFNATWSFNYSLPAGQTIQSVVLTLGIYDDDSQATGNQVASFLLNGSVDLTSDFSSVLEGHGGASGHYDVVSETIPASALSSFTNGAAAFSLALEAPGLGVLGTTPFNGAGLDFSNLTIVSSAPITVPEPSPRDFLLTGAGLIATARFIRLKARMRQRRRS